MVDEGGGLIVAELQRGVTFPRGFETGAVRAGIKSKNLDLMLLASDVPASVAGVFTQNLVQAASVVYSKKIVQGGMARALICNSGNANACTGEQGEQDNQEMASLAAKALGVNANEMLVASTGVIGRPMPMEKLRSAIPLLPFELGSGIESDDEAAKAIMTTDTRPKQLAIEIATQAGRVRIGGIAKGSGMIAPNMATTLCFLTTDASIQPLMLQEALSAVIEKTFNRITVDGDTSTNDMCLLLANGASGVQISGGKSLEQFCEALHSVCLHLAKEVVRDGEGATKVAAITVQEAPTEQAAVTVAKTIAESPLVKTALFGCDPNWGRIIAAAGRAGVPFDANDAAVLIGSHPVFSNGRGREFDKAAVHDYLHQTEVEIIVSLGAGTQSATVWTCDYSYDYIRINASYTT